METRKHEHIRALVFVVVLVVIVLVTFTLGHFSENRNAKEAKDQRIGISNSRVVDAFFEYRTLVNRLFDENTLEFVKYQEYVTITINGVDIELVYDFLLLNNSRMIVCGREPTDKYKDLKSDTPITGTAFDIYLDFPVSNNDIIQCEVKNFSIDGLKKEDIVDALDVIISNITVSMEKWYQNYQTNQTNAFVSESAKIRDGLKTIAQEFMESKKTLKDLNRPITGLKGDKEYPIHFQDGEGNRIKVYFAQFGEKVVKIEIGDGKAAFKFDNETMNARRKDLGYLSYVDEGEYCARLEYLAKLVKIAEDHFSSKREILRKEYEQLAAKKKKEREQKEQEQYKNTKQQLQSEFGKE